MARITTTSQNKNKDTNTIKKHIKKTKKYVGIRDKSSMKQHRINKENRVIIVNGGGKTSKMHPHMPTLKKKYTADEYHNLQPHVKNFFGDRVEYGKKFYKVTATPKITGKGKKQKTTYHTEVKEIISEVINKGNTTQPREAFQNFEQLHEKQFQEIQAQKNKEQQERNEKMKKKNTPSLLERLFGKKTKQIKKNGNTFTFIPKTFNNYRPNSTHSLKQQNTPEIIPSPSPSPSSIPVKTYNTTRVFNPKDPYFNRPETISSSPSPSIRPLYAIVNKNRSRLQPVIPGYQDVNLLFNYPRVQQTPYQYIRPPPGYQEVRPTPGYQYVNPSMYPQIGQQTDYQDIRPPSGYTYVNPQSGYQDIRPPSGNQYVDIQPYYQYVSPQTYYPGNAISGHQSMLLQQDISDKINKANQKGRPISPLSVENNIQKRLSEPNLRSNSRLGNRKNGSLSLVNNRTGYDRFAPNLIGTRSNQRKM